jgi:ring-1,2-phenylacetyl-CoA epoxidase subunit PaaC
LRLADDALVYAQRMGEWIAKAPQLEEDVALANIALDLLGQARSLLTYAGESEGAGRGEDELAYFRDERDFVNAQIFELPIGDFGFTIARMLVTSSYQYALYTLLQDSTDSVLAAVAAKAVKEVDYHRDHATQWTLRLGDGTPESARRISRGLVEVWPYVAELFESDALVAGLASNGVAVDPARLEDPVMTYLDTVLSAATLSRPGVAVRHTGGRRGLHTEHLGYLLAEMQYLARSHPGARW